MVAQFHSIEPRLPSPGWCSRAPCRHRRKRTWPWGTSPGAPWNVGVLQPQDLTISLKPNSGLTCPISEDRTCFGAPLALVPAPTGLKRHAAAWRDRWPGPSTAVQPPSWAQLADNSEELVAKNFREVGTLCGQALGPPFSSVGRRDSATTSLGSRSSSSQVPAISTGFQRVTDL